MMTMKPKTRIEMQSMLEEILGKDSNYVFFQAPSNTSMKYPCIVYSFTRFNVTNADNRPYLVTSRWEIHHMYKNPKNDLKEKFLEVPFCTFDRRIITDGVYNDYYVINN